MKVIQKKSMVEQMAPGEKDIKQNIHYQPYDEISNSYAPLLSNYFYRTPLLHDENGEEISIVNLLNDKTAYWIYGKLLTYLNSANMICVNKFTDSNSARWKPATTQEQLRKLCGIKSKSSWDKAWNILKEHEVIKKIKVHGKEGHYINPLYHIQQTKGHFFNVNIVQAFWRTIRPQIDPWYVYDFETIVKIQSRPDPDVVYELQKNQVFRDYVLKYNVEPPPFDIDFSKLKNELVAPHKEVKTKGINANKGIPQDLSIWVDVPWTDSQGIKHSNYKRGKGSVFTCSNMENVFFTPNAIAPGAPRKRDNVVAIRNMYVDLDFGKDKDGNYLPVEEIKKRKLEVDSFIRNVLPTPTMIVDTRNGYHVYWSIKNTDCLKIEEGTQLLRYITDVIPLADSAAKDITRLLRVPGSKHHKADKGLEPYDVTIEEATPIDYSLEELRNIFENEELQKKTKNWCDSFAQEYLPPQKEKRPQAATPSRMTPVKKELPPITGTIRRSEAKDYIKNNVNMFDYLFHMGYEYAASASKGGGLSNKFCCVLPGHDDNTGDAVIYEKDDNGQEHDKYFCHCIEEVRGYDIIDLHRALKGCDFDTALQDLAALKGLKIEYDRKSDTPSNEGQEAGTAPPEAAPTFAPLVNKIDFSKLPIFTLPDNAENKQATPANDTVKLDLKRFLTTPANDNNVEAAPTFAAETPENGNTVKTEFPQIFTGKPTNERPPRTYDELLEKIYREKNNWK